MAANPHPKSMQKITPWQNKLGAFFMYPARAAVLPAIVMLTLCSVVSDYLSVVGFVIALAVTLTTYTFAFEILRHHADGWEDPPEAMLTVSSGLVFQYLIVLSIAVACIWAIQIILGPAAGLIVLALFSLIQPGYTMVAVIEGSALSALNPFKWLQLMQIFGSGYFLLSLLLFLGSLLQGWISDSVFSFLPNFISLAIVKILGLWLLFSSAYWMGYLIYQYHQKLGYEPSAHNDQAVRGVDRDGLLIEDIAMAIEQGNFDDCMQKFKYEQRERILSAAAHGKYREMLLKKGNNAEIRQHAQTFLHQLLTEKNWPRATSLAIQQYNIDPDFVPLDANATEALLIETRRTGQTGLEKKILTSLIKHFHSEPNIGEWAVRLREISKQDGDALAPIASMLNSALASTRIESQRERILSTLNQLNAN
jgi:hypothetical protein